MDNPIVAYSESKWRAA